MKLLQELNEAKRGNFKSPEISGYKNSTYDAERGNILGGGMFSNNWSREDMKKAVAEIKKSQQFKNVEKRMKYVSTAKEEANGTLCFQSDLASSVKDEYQVVKVYLGGQIRSQPYKHGKVAAATRAGNSSPFRVKSPKPHFVAGKPVESAVETYKNSLDAVASRYDKMLATQDKKVKREWGSDPMGTWHGRNE